MKYGIFLIALVLTNVSFSQFVINNETFYTGPSSTVCIKEQDFIVNADGILHADGTIYNQSATTFISNTAIYEPFFGILDFYMGLITGDGELVFNGSSLQQLDANSSGIDCDIVINNPNNIELVPLSTGPYTETVNGFEVYDTLRFISGDLITNNDRVYFNYTASGHTGASNSSHIVGWAGKTGDAPFVFPVGDGTNLRTASISAPASVTDRFECTYIHADPSPTYSDNSKDPSLYTVSSCEYWMLNRTYGTSNVFVNLTWNSATSCGVTDPADLRVTRWDGSMWKDLGNGSTTGTNAAGSIATSAVVTAFSPFTLGSTSADNPLPITLLGFTAVYNEEKRKVDLDWSTYSEINNDFFTIHKTQDGSNWTEVSKTDGAGFSQGIINYESEDLFPYDGLSYYRLKQTDFNGEFVLSQIVPINVKSKWDGKIIAYPNPLFDDELTISSTDNEILSLELYNSQGQLIRIVEFEEAQFLFKLNLADLAAGTYSIKLISNTSCDTLKITKMN